MVPEHGDDMPLIDHIAVGLFRPSQLALSLLAVVAQRLLPQADGKGRIVAVEILRNISASAHLIREGKIHNIYTVIETHAREGMCTMDTSIKRLYLQGLVTRAEARRRMRHPKQLTVGTAALPTAVRVGGAGPADVSTTK